MSNEDDIYNILQQDIESGFYAPDTRLPSVQKLARRFKSHPIKISKVIGRLLQTKLITARTGVGIFIGSGIVCTKTMNGFEYQILTLKNELKASQGKNIRLNKNLQQLQKQNEDLKKEVTKEKLKYNPDTTVEQMHDVLAENMRENKEVIEGLTQQLAESQAWIESMQINDIGDVETDLLCQKVKRQR